MNERAYERTNEQKKTLIMTRLRLLHCGRRKWFLHFVYKSCHTYVCCMYDVRDYDFHSLHSAYVSEVSDGICFVSFVSPVQ